LAAPRPLRLLLRLLLLLQLPLLRPHLGTAQAMTHSC
jgi:hypothetical protein